MSGRFTLAIVKPDAMGNGHLGKILDRTIQAGFQIKAARLVRLSKAQAEAFYAVHRGKPFYEELTTFMSSGPAFVMVLEQENAVSAWRELIGATDPAEAAPGTIRKDFAEDKGRNAVHGSDSDTNAEKEIAFFFSGMELT